MANNDPDRVGRLAWIRARILLKSNSLAIVMLSSLLAGLLTGVITQNSQTFRMDSRAFDKYINEITGAQTDLIALTKDESIPVEARKQIIAASQKITRAQEILLSSSPKSPFQSIEDFFFPKAEAAQQTPQLASDAFSATTYIRPGILMVMLSAITIFFVVCIVTYFRTTDSEKLKFAMNSIQTILGFYIGVFTGLLGLQA